MKRREFITLLGGAAGVAARGAGAASRRRRIGVLMNAAATEMVPQSYVAAFVQATAPARWIEGQNFEIDVRWNAGDARARAHLCGASSSG